jgi:hypothetical protein
MGGILCLRTLLRTRWKNTPHLNIINFLSHNLLMKIILFFISHKFVKILTQMLAF